MARLCSLSARSTPPTLPSAGRLFRHVVAKVLTASISSAGTGQRRGVATEVIAPLIPYSWGPKPRTGWLLSPGSARMRSNGRIPAQPSALGGRLLTRSRRDHAPLPDHPRDRDSPRWWPVRLPSTAFQRAGRSRPPRHRLRQAQEPARLGRHLKRRWPVGDVLIRLPGGTRPSLGS